MGLFFARLGKLLFLLLLLFVTFRAGTWMSSSRLSVVERRASVLEEEVGDLGNKNRKLSEANRDMTERLSRAERRVQVDEVTYAELTKSLDVSSNQILQLKEELNFYRSIFSPGNNKSGMQVHDLKVNYSADSGQFSYTLSVIQALKHENEVAGVVSMAIEGVQGNDKELLDMGTLGTAPGEMKFKYFQTFKGLFSLPEAFVPIRIKINLERHFDNESREAIKLEQWFAWPVA